MRGCGRAGRRRGPTATRAMSVATPQAPLRVAPWLAGVGRRAPGSSTAPSAAARDPASPSPRAFRASARAPGGGRGARCPGPGPGRGPPARAARRSNPVARVPGRQGSGRARASGAESAPAACRTARAPTYPDAGAGRRLAAGEPRAPVRRGPRAGGRACNRDVTPGAAPRRRRRGAPRPACPAPPRPAHVRGGGSGVALARSLLPDRRPPKWEARCPSRRPAPEAFEAGCERAPRTLHPASQTFEAGSVTSQPAPRAP